MKNNKIYLHIGYPKTATTFFQEKVFSELEGVYYLGKRNNKESDIYSKFYQFIFNEKNEYKKIISEFLKEKLEFQNILISEEDFLFNSLRFNQYSDSIDYRISLKRFFDLVNSEKDKCKLLVTTRDVSELVKSIYGQSFYNYFSTIENIKDFEGFKTNFLFNNSRVDQNRNNFLNALNSDQVENTLIDFFGVENILKCNYKELLLNRSVYFSQYFSDQIYSQNKLLLGGESIDNMKINSRSNSDHTRYSTNEGILYNRLLLIKQKYFPAFRMKFSFFKKLLKQIRFNSQKELKLEMNNDEVNLLTKLLNEA
ncbi:hypothetical protein [Christiangramia echinicola]|uniref:Sulfotransferase domain-containing protein n=1 Tax=Christiangramia echinicola TaxID=279359 RepID=A0A1H1LW82_9FLAO|nr:hypothetical protein [Christiangramia echinicola]SDR78029.1 hypothetical protein SAMN04488552_1001 [Christiangramia echinicola]